MAMSDSDAAPAHVPARWVGGGAAVLVPLVALCIFAGLAGSGDGVFAAFLVAGAPLAVGIAVGFIFGIPRTGQATAASTPETSG